MKPNSFPLHFLRIASSALLCIASSTHAADVTWDITPGTVGIGNGSLTGGSGAWNTSTGNWTTNGGVNNRAWVNANNDTAIFSGTAGTVTLGTGISVGKLIFNNTNYVVSGNTLTLGTGGIITANANATIRSVIAGSAITKTGAATLTLSGNNSYTGTMTVSAGTLAIGDGNTNGTLGSSYRINSPGTLRVRYNVGGVPASWTGTIWNNFTGTGTLALATGKSGDSWGDAALRSDFTGTLQIQSGRVSTSAVTGGGFGSANAIRVLSGGQLTDWRGSAITQNLTIAGTGHGESAMECAIRMGENATPTILSGSVNLSGSATIAAKGTGILTNVISGAAGSTLTVGTSYGNGNVIFTGANNYLGVTAVNAGTLSIGDGATNSTLGSSYQINSPGTLRIRYNTNGVQSSWTDTIWNSFTGNGTLALATGKSNNDWRNAALTSNFTGILQIEGGRVGTSPVTGGGFGGAKAIKVLAGGQLADCLGSVITQDLTIAGTGYGESNLECALRMGEGGTPSILSGLVNLSGNATIGAKGTGILTNVISGAAGSTLTVGTSYCTGNIIFTGANQYLGATTVSAGTLSIGDGITNSTLGSSYQINSPGTLRIRYNTNGVQSSWTETNWNNFTGNGTLALATGKSNDGWGTAALPSNFTGTLHIEGGRVSTSSVTGGGFGGAKAIKIPAGSQLTDWRGSAITQDLTIAGTGYGESAMECAIRMGENASPTILSGLVNLSGNVTIAARGTGILTNVISGAAGSTLTVGTSYGDGTVILAADNTYAGATTIATGTLQIGNGGGTGTLGAGAVANTGTLVFNRSGVLNAAQSISGSGAVKQAGSGNVILGGANNYLGTTTINAGTLTLGRSGALPTGTAVSIGDATLDAGSNSNSTGTLGVTLGSATPARVVFGSGGTLAFSDSSALVWTDYLQLGGNFVSGSSLRVGTTSGGLTDSQLKWIVAPGFSGFGLNSQGYLTGTAYTVPSFDSWQMANLTNQGFSEDLDGDGVTNGIEYFLHGTGDSSGADVFSSVTSSAGNLSVTWTKASTYPGTYGTNFVVQTSSNSASGPWTNQTVGSNLVLTGNSIKYVFPAGAETFVRLVVNETVEEAPLVIDTSNAIPLRSHKYRQDMFAVSLLGSAIKPSNGDPVYEVFFDTGSVPTCLPYGVLNKANLIVDETNVRIFHGTLADKVRGQLTLKSRDGLTNYTLDNFSFYALKNEDGSDKPDDRTLVYGTSIMGGFPAADATSIVGELMAKYSTNGLGCGIISESPGGNLVDNWRYHKSYLKFGNDPALAARLTWSNWKRWFTGQGGFDPITVPGFKVSYHFPTVAGQTYPDIVMPNLIATIDTGAGDLVMRTGPNDPHLQAPYSQFFNTAKVPYWYSTDKCRAVNYGVDVKVAFTGSNGKTISYSFPTADEKGWYIPNEVTIANWNSGIPWDLNNTDLPTNRMNLGNSIYFYCKAYYWDFTNQRVGFFFN